MDSLLAWHFDQEYLKGGGSPIDERTLAAVVDRWPLFGRKWDAKLARAARSLRGCRRWCPARYRTPVAHGIWCAVAARLGLGGLANMSLFLLLSLACYVTPGEAIRLTGATAGDKLRLLDALECQYRLSTRRGLLAALGYRYPPPTSDWQAGHPSLRPWPPLPIPKCGAPCCTTGQVQHSCRLPGGHGGPHVCRARNTDHWELPAERFLEMPASRLAAEARTGDIGLPGLRRAPGLTLD